MSSRFKPAAGATVTTDHWRQVYRTHRPAQLSWSHPHLECSLARITAAAPARDARLLDVGTGVTRIGPSYRPDVPTALSQPDSSARRAAARIR